MTREHLSVLLPRAEDFARPERQPLAPRSHGLDGLRIGFIDNGFAAAALLRDEILGALDSSRVTSLVEVKPYWVPLDEQQLVTFQSQADVVVGGLCNSPPSTAWGVRDAVELERRGIPAVAVATAFYSDLLRETILWDAIPQLRRVILPYPLEGAPEEFVRAVGRSAATPIITALTDPAAPELAEIDRPEGELS